MSAIVDLGADDAPIVVEGEEFPPEIVKARTVSPGRTVSIVYRPARIVIEMEATP